MLVPWLDHDGPCIAETVELTTGPRKDNTRRKFAESQRRRPPWYHSAREWPYYSQVGIRLPVAELYMLIGGVPRWFQH